VGPRGQALPARAAGRLLRRELERRGAVAVHGNRLTDSSPPSADLLAVDYPADQPRSAIAAATSSGRSVMT
jgi:hypothetical protein